MDKHRMNLPLTRVFFYFIEISPIDLKLPQRQLKSEELAYSFCERKLRKLIIYNNKTNLYFHLGVYWSKTLGNPFPCLIRPRQVLYTMRFLAHTL